jgi:hypothetical protein
MNQPIPAYEKLIDSVRRELAEAEAYREAFYEIAKMFDMRVMLPNPISVWRQQMRPKLQMKLDSLARANRTLQQAGELLDLAPGDDTHTMLVPAIEKLKTHAAELSKATPPSRKAFKLIYDRGFLNACEATGDLPPVGYLHSAVYREGRNRAIQGASATPPTKQTFTRTQVREAFEFAQMQSLQAFENGLGIK